MRYVSLFSGIEAASVAWKDIGWEPVAFSEIEPFPCALLKERFPDVPNLGDITKVDWSHYAGTVDVIVGGSPCQSFSIAGDRTGLAGESGLMFEYIRAVHEVMPRYFVWENVPGALSCEGGTAFGQLVTEMDELGYCVSWRVLDAQFFGVAQRRRRVFVVGSLGDTSSAEILFERESLRWDNPSSRDKRKELAARPEGCAGSGSYTLQIRCGCAGGGKGALIQDDVSATLSTSNVQTLFQSVSVLPLDTTQVTSPQNGNNQQWGDPCHPLTAAWNTPTVICMADANSNAAIDDDMCGTLKVGGEAPIVSDYRHPEYVVRRLTPTECERLQGFPEGWTDIEFKRKPASDTARYKALGNSMAVPVMAWIGERIERISQHGYV